mmetsp:Transcript_22635/g.52864  ORF Transcript_22635/g.52864 Transcript_22635/m.52864 type:complete len:251 (-) Transcript_22635:769-1521(-)
MLSWPPPRGKAHVPQQSCLQTRSTAPRNSQLRSKASQQRAAPQLAAIVSLRASVQMRRQRCSSPWPPRSSTSFRAPCALGALRFWFGGVNIPTASFPCSPWPSAMLNGARGRGGRSSLTGLLRNCFTEAHLVSPTSGQPSSSSQQSSSTSQKSCSECYGMGSSTRQHGMMQFLVRTGVSSKIMVASQHNLQPTAARCAGTASPFAKDFRRGSEPQQRCYWAMATDGWPSMSAAVTRLAKQEPTSSLLMRT